MPKIKLALVTFHSETSQEPWEEGPLCPTGVCLGPGRTWKSWPGPHPSSASSTPDDRAAMFIFELCVKISGLVVRLWKRLTLCKGKAK